MLLKFVIFAFIFYFILKIISRLFVFTTGSSSHSFERKQHHSQSNRSQDTYTRSSTSRPDNLEGIEEAEFEDITEEESKESNTS